MLVIECIIMFSNCYEDLNECRSITKSYETSLSYNVRAMTTERYIQMKTIKIATVNMRIQIPQTHDLAILRYYL